MKNLAMLMLFSFSSLAHAIPVSYIFGGHITHVSDVTDIPEVPDGHVKEGQPQLKDWLEEGDRYRGRMTFDTDTIAYGSVCDFGAAICGGLTFFEMSLGDRIVSLNFSANSAIPNIELSSASDTRFRSWLQVLGTFDTFDFDHGNIGGVDSAYWEGFSGEAKYFVRVPEPTPIALLVLASMLIVLRAFAKRRATSRLLLPKGEGKLATLN